MTWDFRLQFSIWRNASGNQKSEVTVQDYILIYTKLVTKQNIYVLVQK